MIMAHQILIRTCSFYLIAAVSSLIAVSSVNAQEQPQPSSPIPDSVQKQQPIRREQAPLPLDRVYETPIEQFEPAFTDVPRNHWAYEAVTRLFYIGVVKGEAQSTNQSTKNN